TRVIASATTAISYNFQWGYDRDGRVLWTKYPDKEFVGTPSAPLTYDALGRMTAIPGYVSGVQFDSVTGATTSLTYANGVVNSYTYDANRRWLTRISAVKGATTLSNLNYAVFDADGKLRELDTQFNGEGNDVRTYRYDGLNQLVLATS